MKEKTKWTSTLMSTVEELTGKGLPGEAHGLIADHISRCITIAQQSATHAQDENYRAQLRELVLHERFPSLTHLADDMGEALLRTERALRGLVKSVVCDVCYDDRCDPHDCDCKCHEQYEQALINAQAVLGAV